MREYFLFAMGIVAIICILAVGAIWLPRTDYQIEKSVQMLKNEEQAHLNNKKMAAELRDVMKGDILVFKANAGGGNYVVRQYRQSLDEVIYGQIAKPAFGYGVDSIMDKVDKIIKFDPKDPIYVTELLKIVAQ